MIMSVELSNSNQHSVRAWIPWVVLVIWVTALSRLLPHPWNFTPVTAMALFGGAYLGDRKLALIVTLVALWISDLLLNNLVYHTFFDSFAWTYPDAIWTYVAFAMVVLLGSVILQEKRTIWRVGACGVASSTLFFLISNFGVWASGQLYPPTGSGLIACYIAGLPFYANNAMGDLFYCGVLFGGAALVVRRWARPSLA